jgi:phosphopantetheinyl transferase
MGEISKKASAIVALVSIDWLRARMARVPISATDIILSAEERGMIVNAATEKRRSEFLAGRLAAKCASATLRHQHGEPALPVRQATVYRSNSSGPKCKWSDGLVHCVSIAHSGKFAVALAVSTNSAAGIDLEPSTRNFSLDVVDLLHPLEKEHVALPAEARLCWVVREAWGKYTTRGVAVDFNEVATISIAATRWLMRRRDPGTSIIAAGHNAAFCIAVALQIDEANAAS